MDSAQDLIATEHERIIASDKASVWHHLTPQDVSQKNDPMVMVSGKGMWVRDSLGRDFLDATSGGVWTVNLGYGRSSIADAIRDQLVEMCFFGNSFGSVPGAQFAEQLLERLPGLGKVYYSNSGSEANEKAYKMVRQLAHVEGDGSRHKIIYRDRDYHGTTIAALSSTGQSERKDQYGPFVPGFSSFSHCCCYRCPFGKVYGECDIECARDLETAIQREGPDTVGAVVVEPITAGGGVIVPVPEYFPIIREICDRYGILLHIDEVVCGLGRTGKWFGYQHFDVQPDIVTMAKGLASGYAAISCTATTDDIHTRLNGADRLHYFRDISTFGGCTAGPAAGLETLRIIEDEKLLSNTSRMGVYLKDQLLALAERHPLIGDVRGKGLFVGLELVADRQTRAPVDESVAARVAAECFARGVLIGRTNRSFQEFNNTLCISPALIAGKRELDTIVAALDAALTTVEKG